MTMPSSEQATATIEQKPLPALFTQPLALDVAAVKGELVPVAAQLVGDTTLAADDPLALKAAEIASRLVAIPSDRYDDARAAIDSAGGEAMRVASHQSDMLKGKLKPLMAKTDDGGPVAQALIQLRDQVSVLDPSDVNFTPGWFAKAASHLPLIGSPVQKYFNRFETGQGAINSVIKSLENGKKMLQNDNVILAGDQKAWRTNTHLLKTQIAYLRAVDAALEAHMPEITDVDHQHFLQEEILFPLRQRIQDLLQRLAVNQQGVLVTEVLIRNNRELIRGVDRALFVTVDALNIAVAAAMSLANQKLVLDAVDALNSTTNGLISGTAKRLRTQGAAIQKRASSTMLDEQVLRQSFADVYAALDDVSTFRRNALPQMAKTIVDLDTEAQAAEKAIVKMERGDKESVAHDLQLDVILKSA